VSSFGFGGSNSHIILDDAYNFLRMRNLRGNHNTIHEPPSPRLLELARVDSTSGGYQHNNMSYTNGHSEPNGSHEINGTTYLSNGTTRSNGVSNGDEIIPNKASLIEGEVPNGFDQKILVWSAADEDGIARLAAAWGPYFSSLSIPDSEKTHYLCDLAHTLAVRRSNLPWKTFAIANPVQDLHNIADKLTPPIRSTSSPGLAFIFTGVRKYYSNLLSLVILFLATANLAALVYTFLVVYP
jgi:acyl transferase domain-containing protein